MFKEIRYERVERGIDSYQPPYSAKDAYFPKNPFFRLAMSAVHRIHDTLSLLTRGDFGGLVVYNPALFPGSKGAGIIITRDFGRGTFTISEPGRENLLRLPARLVHDSSSAE